MSADLRDGGAVPEADQDPDRAESEFGGRASGDHGGDVVGHDLALAQRVLRRRRKRSTFAVEIGDLRAVPDGPDPVQPAHAKMRVREQRAVSGVGSAQPRQERAGPVARGPHERAGRDPIAVGQQDVARGRRRHLDTEPELDAPGP